MARPGTEQTAIIRRPRFSVRFITEKSEFLIEYAAGDHINNNFMTESIIAMTSKNSMEDDSAAFALTIAGDVLWDKILNENDLVIINIEPNEQNPGDPFRQDFPNEPTIVLGLVSEVRVEADYENDTKMYRITGQSLQKAFIQFDLRTIRQAGMLSPSTVGWMDYDANAPANAGDGEGSRLTSQEPLSPVQNVVINSEYGIREDPFGEGRRMHSGIDFDGSTGDSVYSVLDGTVVYTGKNESSGNFVSIQHEGNYFTHYAHLDAITISNGAKVNRGDKIGVLGNTGMSTGPHLHFEVTKGDASFGEGATSESINPRTLLGNAIPLSTGANASTTGGGGFAQLLMGKSAREVIQSLVSRFTEYMWYDFDGAESANVPFDDIFDNRVNFYYDTWEEDEQLMNPLPITSYEGSFNNLIRSAAPRPFLEYFWDTIDDGYGQEKAVMVVRRTPFDKDDWYALDTHTITSRTVVSESVAKNDLETFAVYNCVPNLTSDDLSLSSAVPYYHPSLVAKYGYSLLEVEHIYINIEGATGSTEDDTVSEDDEAAMDMAHNESSMPAKYARKLYNWYFNNPNFFSGEIVVTGHPDFRIGNRLIYKNVDETETWEYYIESVEHNFTYTDGYTTTLGVTRGLRVEVDDNNKVTDDGGRYSNIPEPEVFRGGYLGEMSYKQLEEAKRAEDAALMSNGNTTGGGVSGPGGPKARKAAEMAVHFAELEARDGNTTGYDWGGGRGSTNPFKGDPPYYADCSSFVYWMYDFAGVRFGPSSGVTTNTLLKDSQLSVVGNIGSNITEADLQVGDLVFFYNSSGHVGIYVGGGNWVGMNGSGYKNLARGLENKPLFSGYWAHEFKGQVRRLK